MKPLYVNNCDKCELIGIFFNKYDIYICHNEGRSNGLRDGNYTCIARYGNDANEYISAPINLNALVQRLQKKIIGLLRNEAIMLIISNYMPDLIINNLTTTEEYDSAVKTIKKVQEYFNNIEVNPQVIFNVLGIEDITEHEKIRKIVESYCITQEDLRSSIVKYDIESIPHAKCSICKESTKYEIIKNSYGVDVYFNGACNCIKGEGNRLKRTTFEVLVNFINNHTDYRTKLAAMISCGLIPISIPTSPE